VIPVHDRSPEMPPREQRKFPSQEGVPDTLHVRDTRFLLLIVFGYLAAMLGGVVVLNVLTPVTQATMHSTEIVDGKVTGR
jgi:hypothetical protein